MNGQPLPQGVTFSRADNGNFHQLIAAKNWSSTPLGPQEKWPLSLRGYVHMVLTIPTPAILFWGPELTQIYNEGYAEIMGKRHPTFLGEPYAKCWPETAPLISPWMERVLKNREVVQVDRSLIPLTRNGFYEEAYFSFTFSPVQNDNGEIAGILQIVSEMTSTVLAERRLESLRELSSISISDQSPVEPFFEFLSRNTAEIRCALLFAPVEEKNEITCVKCIGIEGWESKIGNAKLLMRKVDEVFATGKAVQIHQFQSELPHESGVPPWNLPTESALALPLLRAGTEVVEGVLILGISPCLKFDRAYRSYFEGIAQNFSSAFAATDEKKTQLKNIQMREQFLKLSQLDLERMKAERDLRERFVATLSHDLRNPLSAAKMNAQLLAWVSEETPESRNRIISSIVKSIDRADQMIQDLLDANRLKAGFKLPIQVAAAKMRALVQDTLNDLNLQFNNRFVLEPGFEVSGYWSAESLRRILENLASNAIKYGQKNAPVTVSIVPVPQKVRLSVHNVGNELSAEDVAHIFEPFRRSYSAVKSGHQGWGLGLTLVRGLAISHGGSVEVASEPSCGTTFTVELPLDSRPYQEQNEGGDDFHIQSAF